MARKAARKRSGARAPGAAPASPIIDEVKDLVQLMVEHDLGEVDITDGDRKILLRRGPAYVQAMPIMAGQFAAPAAPALAAAPPPAPAVPPEREAQPEKLLEVRSPMVGTFYTAASPESEPYVTVGARVDEETVVCIVEAMKVMNEVKAECSGTVAEICVRDAQPVEYGQVLFRVRPA